MQTHGRLRRGTFTAFDGPGLGGSMFDVLMDGFGISFPAAVQWSRDYFHLAPGMSPPKVLPEVLSKREHEKARRTAETAAAEAAGIDAAFQIWSATVPLAGTPGEVYLRKTRRIDVCHALSGQMEPRAGTRSFSLQQLRAATSRPCI